MILEATLIDDYTPGSNQSEELACADWRFLLPSMSLNQVICLGAPKLSTLKALSAMAKFVHIIPCEGDLEVNTKIATMENAQTYANDENLSTCPEASLIFVSSKRGVDRLASSPEYLKMVSRKLEANGAIYCDSCSTETSILTKCSLLRAAHREQTLSTGTFWIYQQRGKLRTAVPHGNRHISSFFFKNVLFGLSRRMRLLSKTGWFLSKLGLIDFFSPYHAIFLRNKLSTQGGTAPPRFLCELASKAEINIDEFKFGLAARGKYNSNKVIFFLFRPQDRYPDIVVKVTRTKRFNCRLEHEWQMLSTVKQRFLAETGSYPEPLFLGYHHGLAVLGQKSMRGRPFRAVSSAEIGCPVFADAISWITDLGKRSSNVASATAIEVSESLENLFNLFARIYKPSAKHRNYILEQIGIIAQSKTAFPIVFGHGDAGEWNIFVDHNDKVMFLDWEAAEPQGMPLWDLLYFLNSFGNWASRRHSGNRDILKSFDDHFLRQSDLNELFSQTVKFYCEEIGLDKALVEPLFICCWMHRALRQATWATSLQEAHFVKLLELTIDSRKAEGLSAIYAPG